jgi:succinate dehydrogenase/fumarate reductase cytochrome b subunit
MTRKLHRITGGVIALFLFTHLAVHLFALAGPEAHNAALKSVQWIYRNPVIEPLLIAALLFQIGLGIRLALRRWREPGKNGWAKLQLASGFYLAYFIFNHTGAALYTRYGAGLDTDFWWVSGPLQHPKMAWWFYPYYALAVLSVGVHLGAILHFNGKEKAARIASWSAVPVVLAYWASFGGWLYPLEIHPEYRAYYDGLLAIIGLG